MHAPEIYNITGSDRNWWEDNIIGIISLLISIGTFIVAIMAYRKFLVKRAQEKQLEVVLDF